MFSGAATAVTSRRRQKASPVSRTIAAQAVQNLLNSAVNRQSLEHVLGFGPKMENLKMKIEARLD